MLTTVKFSKATPTRLQVTVLRNGTPEITFAFAISSLPRQRELAALVPCRLSDLTPVMLKAMDEGEAEVCFGAEDEKFQIKIRGIRNRADTAVIISDESPYKALLKAFASRCEQPEPILVWDGVKLLACVDIDYHKLLYSSRPTYEQLVAAASVIRPMPVAFHASHGRGCKLYYTATEGFDADEIAAAGAMAWLAADGRATAEIKSDSRHPHYERDGVSIPTPIQFPGIQIPDLVEIARWNSREVKQDAVEAWLEQNNYIPGKRYPHSRCLIEGEEPSHGEPVYVGDAGIFCQRCSAKGAVYGSRRTPGFVPFVALIGGMDSEIYEMANKAVHWEHARYVLRAMFRLPDNLLRLAYACSLKMLHGAGSPIIPAAFNCDAIARIGGKWAFTNDPNLTTVDKTSKNMLAKLPVTWSVWRNEADIYSVKIDAAKVESINHVNRRLDELGYSDLTPVHGMQMWGRKLPYSADTIPFLDRFLHLPADRRPKYIGKEKRTADVISASWGLLEHTFPGIDRKFVKTLIALRGVTESGSSNVYLCVYGPAQSGKSTTTAIVAGLLGDKHGEVPYQKDTTRFRQAINDVVSSGSFVVVDEIFKTALKEKQTFRQAMDCVLTLTKNSRTHQLYVGSVPMPSNAVFVFTDIEIPQEVRDDIQLARRLIYLRLLERIDWRESMNAVGLDKPENFRRLSPEHAFAADVICSECCDEYFTESRSLTELVALCGAEFLENSRDFTDPIDLLKRLWEVTLAAPPLSEPDSSRIAGEGFRKISQGEVNELRDIWDQLADGLTGKEWKYSRRISEIDWSALLTKHYATHKLPKGITVDIRHYKDATVYLRFRLGHFDRPTATNGDILRCGLPQPTLPT